MGEYAKRANNHEQLLGALKDVNHMIQKAARLRVGAAKQRIVAQCRAAIKNNNMSSLFKIIKHAPWIEQCSVMHPASGARAGG